MRHSSLLLAPDQLCYDTTQGNQLVRKIRFLVYINKLLKLIGSFYDQKVLFIAIKNPPLELKLLNSSFQAAGWSTVLIADDTY